jgi:phosphopantothenoylcysteine decarboxylase/phosphopantothenate--cysteine ligase
MSPTETTSRPDVDGPPGPVSANEPRGDVPGAAARGDDLMGRHIVVGVTGGIASYKAALLVRRLVGAGAVVDVILTRGAREFIGAVTFEGITGRAVRSEVWEDVADGTHVELGRRADAVVVYPATAHALARFAHGLADDLLATTVLVHHDPVIVAPAMHTEMWEHPATAANLVTLRERGYHVVGPETGPLMGGDVGVGRVAEPEDVVARLRQVLGVPAPLHDDDGPATSGPLFGRRVLVTAGGTREAIDPVRFLGNRSSGRMGFALAEAAAEQGAEVVLVAGPSELPTPLGVRRIDVVSAREMDAAVQAHEGGVDVVLMTAAVADFRPSDALGRKWRRTDGPPAIELVANPDILAGIVQRRGDASRPVVVGFAAETGDLEASAHAKLTAKGVDLIVANDVAQPGVGFEGGENAVLILHRDGARRDVPRMSKRLVADIILAELVPHLG